MPAEVVNQRRLAAEYAVHTASLALRVHRGVMPGAPVATGDVRILAIGGPLFDSIRVQTTSGCCGFGVVADFSAGSIWNIQATAMLIAYSISNGIASRNCEIMSGGVSAAETMKIARI